MLNSDDKDEELDKVEYFITECRVIYIDGVAYHTEAV